MFCMPQAAIICWPWSSWGRLLKQFSISVAASLASWLRSDIICSGEGIAWRQSAEFQHREASLRCLSTTSHFLHQRFGACPGLKTLLMLAEQMVQRIEYVHLKACVACIVPVAEAVGFNLKCMCKRQPCVVARAMYIETSSLRTSSLAAGIGAMCLGVSASRSRVGHQSKHASAP